MCSKSKKKVKPYSVVSLKASNTFVCHTELQTFTTDNACLSDETPAVKVMKFYFERSEKEFRGRPQETIITTLNKDTTKDINGKIISNTNELRVRKILNR